jgi:subtilisin family serine protease
MFSLRKTISAVVPAGVAIAALSVIASAPAASGGFAHAPLLVNGASAQARAVDRPAWLSVSHAQGSRIGVPLLSQAQAGNSAVSIDLVPSGLESTRDGNVRIIVETSRAATVRAVVESSGGRVERSWRNLVQVAVPRNTLSQLGTHPAVDAVRAPSQAMELAVSGEEVNASLAADWHAKGLAGKGVKVAVIDTGFRGLPMLQAAGELPANVVTQDFCGGEFADASRHGAAVAEIVHEVAPDAQLYLVCVDTEVDLAAAEAYAKSQGVQIVNHSVGWEGPYRDDGSGPIGTIVADARANGILWVNAAGNEAQTHWSGTFNSIGGMHGWSSDGDLGNTFVWQDGEGICGFLKWDEWPAAVSDFDLGLFLSGSNELIAASAGDQNGTQSPFEGGCIGQESGTDLVVFWAIVGYRVTTSPRLDLVSWSGPLEYQVPAGSITTPASSSSVLAVGAMCWQSRQLEPYSSQGPTIDGRVKPELVGHDSVSGMTYGPFERCPSGFAGTSAASPEVAGAAALVKQAYPAYGPAELQQYLMRNAKDLGSPGVDNATGAGELTLPKPPDVVAPSATALVSTGRAGHVVKLLSRIEDGSGEIRLVVQVKRNGRTVSSLRRGFMSISGPTSVALAWKAPTEAVGSYVHCVTAFDRAGNSSAQSCAKLVIRTTRK